MKGIKTMLFGPHKSEYRAAVGELLDPLVKLETQVRVWTALLSGFASTKPLRRPPRKRNKIAFTEY